MLRGADMLIVDAQVHIWAADRPDRLWPPGRAAQAQKPYPVTKEMVLAAMDEAGVDRAVLIPRRGKGTTTTSCSRLLKAIPIGLRRWDGSRWRRKKAAIECPDGNVSPAWSASG